ncbi:DUF58 domain-containing protein [Reichenbachiella sp.]|uniref:DUF58 domain-containing protein n=1 Tax=Reichenbachiella sp. TaxID=2184521 RepID=UPI003B5C12CE
MKVKDLNTEFPKDIFTTLKELLEMERFARNFLFKSSRKKVKSVLGGKHASKLRGRGLYFEEVRNYVQGDDIRNIDWKVTARTKVTHTRVFSEEKEKPALIIVDQSKSMFFGSKQRTKSVVAAELAAIAAFKVLKQGDRVGGIVLADQEIDVLKPKRDRRNILRFLEKVVSRNRELIEGKSTLFGDLLKETMAKVQNLVTHDYLVVLISDFHRYSPEVIQFITRIKHHNDVVLIKVTDPLEQDLPPAKFVAGDTETQITIDGKNNKLRKQFADGFDMDLSDFKIQMRKHGIPVIQVNTVDPVDEQLKEAFGQSRK